MPQSHTKFDGFAIALVCLGAWFLVFVFAMASLAPGDLLGRTVRWGLADFVGAAVLIGGAYHTARRCRFLPMYFTYGVLGGLAYVGGHWPGWHEIAGMPRGTWVLVVYGLYWLAIMLCMGLLCRGAASYRIRRLGALEQANADQCRKCGYLLYGLPEPRCPECGEPFDPMLLKRYEDASQALQELGDTQQDSAADGKDDGGPPKVE